MILRITLPLKYNYEMDMLQAYALQELLHGQRMELWIPKGADRNWNIAFKSF